MARIRTIKPGFGQHEELSELPAETHLLAATLLTYSDDEGYFKANPKLVKAHCCPLRDDQSSIGESLQQLHQAGYLELFTGTDGKEYGRILKFNKHQKVSKPYPSQIKELYPFQGDSGNGDGTIPEDSPPEGNGMEREKDSRRDASASSESAKDFVWRVGVQLLRSAGENEKSARSFIGGLCKKHGDEAVREAVGRAAAVAPAEPKAWLTAALTRETEEPYMGDT